MKELKNGSFVISLDDKNGFINSIKHPSGHPVSNFICPPEVFSEFSIPDTYRFGSVRIGYRFKSFSKWHFCESTSFEKSSNLWEEGKLCREFSSRPVLKNTGERCPFHVSQSYLITKDKECFVWKFSIENQQDDDIELGEISIPIPFNNSVRKMTVGEMYCQRVIIHPFIAGHSSYVLVQRLDGVSPYLLMLPDNNTPVECLAQPNSETFEGLRFAGGGIKRLYIHSLAAKESLGWKTWFHGHSSTILKAKKRLQFGFAFRWVNSFEEVYDILYDLGKVAFRVIPGMVLPQDTHAQVLIKTKKNIKKIASENGIITKGEKNTRLVRFIGKGLKKLKVEYGKNEWATLIFNSIPALDTLIKNRARFIVNNQQVNNKKSDRYGAFMMWDSDEKKMVFDAPAPYFYGCSDELGFADPLFLAEKNTRYPEENEITSLERYTDEFLFGKIQDKKTYGVSLWFGDETWRHYRGSDIVRSFNYPHVFNIYYSMYLIGKYYSLTKSHSPIEYLKMAYRTADAFYSLKMIAGDSYTIGNMGASMLLKLLDALEKEEMHKERLKILSMMNKSAEFFSKTKYPYGSEFSYDTTGLETVYFFRKYLSKKSEKADETLRCALALRHRHPLWCQSGNDVRCGMGNGKSGERGWDEICFSYMAPLNGWAILDAFEEKNDPLLIETGYAGILGCWSLVEQDGTAHNLYTHEPEAMLMDSWTSEMGLALFASFESMGTYIVNDPDFGKIGYGCDFKTLKDKTVISPKRWASAKIVDTINRLSIMTPNGIIVKVVCHKDGSIDAVVKPVIKRQENIFIKIFHHEGKTMDITYNGKVHRSDKGKVELQIPSGIWKFKIEIL